MSLKSVNKKDVNTYELEIEVDGATFSKAVDQAYRKDVKNINVPGFRKGHAPKALIEKMYGSQVFFEDAINAVYPESVDAAVKEAKLEVVSSDMHFELVSADEKEGLVFKVTATTKPEVELGEYKGIKARRDPSTVSDEEVDAEINKVRDRNSRLEVVEGRKSKIGDTCVIDFEGFLNDQPFDGGKGENFPLELGSNQFIPGFEEQVADKEVGQEFDVNVSFPEDYHVKELAGQPTVFKVKLNEIKEKQLPEVDDEFAKDVSEFDTLDEYKADLKSKLEESATKSADNDVEDQLIDKIIKDMKAEIPEVMYENRVNESVNEFDYRLRSQGMNIETYLQYTGMDMDSFKKTFREQAERQVKVRLALEKIVELENIVPTDDEIEDEFKKLADAYKMEVEKVKTLIHADDIKKDLAVNKAIDLVKESASITQGRVKKSK